MRGLGRAILFAAAAIAVAGGCRRVAPEITAVRIEVVGADAFDARDAAAHGDATDAKGGDAADTAHGDATDATRSDAADAPSSDAVDAAASDARDAALDRAPEVMPPPPPGCKDDMREAFLD